MIAALLAIMLLAYGCASNPKGPVRLELTPEDGGGQTEEYYTTTDAAVYDDGALRVRVRALNPGGAHGREGDAVSTLSSRGYLLFETEVANISDGKRIIFKPSYAAIHTSHLDYGRALDFTDLYEIAGVASSGSMKSSFKSFFDLDKTLMPGESIKKILAFRPLDDHAGSVRLELNDIYVGTDTTDVLFLFKGTKADAAGGADGAD